MRSPGIRSIFDSTGEAEYGAAVKTSSRSARSSVSSAVISFVVLAIGRWPGRRRLRVERVARPRVHDDRGGAARLGWRLGGRAPPARRPAARRRAPRPAACPGPHSRSLIFWPETSACGSSVGVELLQRVDRDADRLRDPGERVAGLDRVEGLIHAAARCRPARSSRRWSSPSCLLLRALLPLSPPESSSVPDEAMTMKSASTKATSEIGASRRAGLRRRPSISTGMVRRRRRRSAGQQASAQAALRSSSAAAAAACAWSPPSRPASTIDRDAVIRPAAGCGRERRARGRRPSRPARRPRAAGRSRSASTRAAVRATPGEWRPVTAPTFDRPHAPVRVSPSSATIRASDS